MACGPAVSIPEVGSTSTGGDDPPVVPSGSSGSLGTTSTLPPNPDPPPRTTTDTFEPTTSGSSDTGSSSSGSCGGFLDCCGFLDCDDPTAGPSVECNTFLQDCPRGEKCTPWSNNGGTSVNATRCSPIEDDPDQPGEPCTVEGSALSGFDSCDLGSMCWGVSAETNTGVCTPHCAGAENAPICEDNSTTCTQSGDSVLALCVFGCDPLASSCLDGQGCYPSNYGFICAPDGSGSGGGAFETCESANGCDPGNVCVDGEAAQACNSTSCCSPLCSLEAPDCPDSMICWPWFAEGQVLPGGEDVGYCADAGWDGG